MTQWFQVLKEDMNFGEVGDLFEAYGPNDYGEYKRIDGPLRAFTTIFAWDITDGSIAPVAGPDFAADMAEGEPIPWEVVKAAGFATRFIQDLVNKGALVHEVTRNNSKTGWSPIYPSPDRVVYGFSDSFEGESWRFVDEPAGEPDPIIDYSVLPLDGKKRKEIPLWTFISGYFPDAIVALASLSFKANEKHNPGQRMHWSREKSSDHKDCIARHLMDEERIDPETGEPEAVAAFWRAGANAQLVIEKLRAEGKYHR